MPRRNRNKNKSHQEIIKKRDEKQTKKSSSVKSKEYHLKEFLKLSSKEDLTNKDVAMKVMNIVEEVNEEGLNDKRYMDIMDLLMKIHKSEEQINNDTWSDWGNYDNIPIREDGREIINSYNRLIFPPRNEREEYERTAQETVVEIQHLAVTLDEMELHDDNVD
jgi:hypothetical protein